MNKAHAFALSKGLSVTEARQEYDDSCVVFAGDYVDELPGRLLYFDIGDPFHRWRYHATIEIDGFVHDLWEDVPIEREQYLKQMRAYNVDYPAD